jgi:predicted Rossmann fold nucleotide-binding protein DprA/Smf involved in DNA uptake
MTINLSPDTKAILLLCSYWGKKDNTIKPLSLAEYNKLTGWLRNKELRPSNLFDLDTQIQNSSFPFDSTRFSSLLNRGGIMAVELESWLNIGGWVISRADEDYPQRLKRVLGRNAPPLLFGIGIKYFLSTGGIALVGSRDISQEGQEATQRISVRCAERRITLISGGARGVDQTAMQSALEADGKVVGVLANDLARTSVTGICREYIEQEKLILLSPFNPNAHFQVWNAMSRNKVIYGLSDAAVVISSSNGKGGTWEGALENLRKWHIPIFVRKDSSVSGNLELIDKGAFPLPEEAYNNPDLLLSKSHNMSSSTKVKTLFD